MRTAIFNDPLRKCLAGPALQLLAALFLAFLAAVVLIGPDRLVAQIEGDRGVAPRAKTSDIEVSGIEVNVTADSGEEARKAGWKLAQRKAWKQIKGPEITDAQLDSMVSAVVIEEERIGPRRYIARLGVIFDRAKAGQFINSGGASAATRSGPLLVIPILYSGGVRQVFEVRGDWQKAWARFQPSESPIDYVRPIGAGGESLVLTAGQPGRRSRLWWREVLGRFGAADVIIPVAKLERQWPGGPVKGSFTARYGPDNKFLENFSLVAKNEEALPAMLDKAVARIDNIYAKALADGVLKPDPTLLAEQKALDAAFAQLRAKLLGEVSPEPGPVSSGASVQTGDTSPTVEAAVATYTVQFASPDARAVDAALAAVRGAPGVRGAATTSLAIGGTSVMRVSITGSLDSLANALRAQGWQVSTAGNVLRISR